MTTSRSGWARIPLPGPSVATFLQFLFLGLSTPASPSRVQLKLQMPAGLSTLQAVEGSEVVLPVWYTLNGELPSSQPWEVPVVIWFLDQKGKQADHVSGKTAAHRGCGGKAGNRAGRKDGEGRLSGKSKCPQSFPFYSDLAGFLKYFSLPQLS
ncbi:endothelial cell-selective adhesion molecule-like [Echinops telfairi]|uniref:Endothelial cell-selective adhesion molecule-like n=1 Tax=Echinops telfairi TaxID=9371 RepID=A0AC55CHJ2_ECHTE|nr:endothelial cell-selective adhesion molecule-like [Echinops telfairi]